MKAAFGDLKDIVKDCKKPYQFIRILILILIYCGLGKIKIASLVGVHRTTVYRTEKKHKLAEGETFSDKPRKGRKRKLTKEIEQDLVYIIKISPRTIGFPQNYWTLSLLCTYVKQKYNISVSKSTIYRTLERNNISCHRPRQRVHSPDPDYLKKKEKIETLLKNPPENAIVLFEDEHDAHLNPSIRRCWQEKGKQINVYTPGKNEKLYIFGCYNPFAKQIVAWKIFERKRSEEFFEFLRHLVNIFPGKRIILILDNFIIHKSKKLQKALEQYPEVSRWIEFVWLPTYAPELNPMERAWGVIKARAEANYLFKTKEEFRKAIDETIKGMLNEKLNITTEQASSIQHYSESSVTVATQHSKNVLQEL